VDKPPSPPARKSTPKMSKPLGPEDTEDPTSAKGALTSQSNTGSGHDVAHQFAGPKPTVHSEASPENPESFGLEAPGGRHPREAHPCQGLKGNHTNIHASQRPRGTIQTLFGPDFILTDTYQHP
jgi:hypothetical protein